MIKIIDGDLMQATENIIGNQTNCKGVMGSGVADQIKRKYPIVFTKYRELYNSTPVTNKDASLRDKLLGTCQIVKVEENKYVANLFGQGDYGRNPNVTYTSKDSLEKALRTLCKVAKENRLTVALPYQIGSGLGNAKWDEVYKIIDEVFKDYEVTLYKLNKPNNFR